MKVHLFLYVFSAFILHSCISDLFSGWLNHGATTNLNEILDEASCDLPCFAGLTVGISREAQVVSFMDSLEILGGTTIKDAQRYNYAIPTYPDGLFLISVEVESEVVKALSTQLTDPERWFDLQELELASVFSVLGSPDEVYLLFFSPPPGYSLLLIYENEGVILQYRAVVTSSREVMEGNLPLSLCSIASPVTETTQINLWVQQPHEENWILNAIPDLYDEREMRPWIPLENLGNLTYQELVDNFSTGSAECVELISLNELRDIGYEF